MKTPKEKLEDLRGKIDAVDADLTRLFQERQRVSNDISHVKEEGNLAITDIGREEKVIASALALADEDKKAETAALMRTLISLSKLRQFENLGLTRAFEFPDSSARAAGPVAFQGVAGAWSEHAARIMFPDDEYITREYFEDVFEAVKSGQASLGVLPIENSRTGAIGEVYDLLRRHACYIVGQVQIGVAQCLLGVQDAVLGDVREVFSHAEGFAQCKRFLKGRDWELTRVRNTAVAAEMVSERGSGKYAAIGSRRAAEVNDLKILAEDIMDDPKNRTRFIAIAPRPIYDENSDTVTVTFSTRHQSGALCSVLQPFQLSGINLTRIESRPAASPDSYRFFADLDANILDSRARDAIGQATAQAEYFEVLGCYRNYEEAAI
ncbi:MAG: chorismate mutase [Oscillospiraceae bacterium]|jgi:chorismate mutase/prephenate dehydratase|nr:chorismate mutase [Oscillospiraceae bacterium]